MGKRGKTAIPLAPCAGFPDNGDAQLRRVGIVQRGGDMFVRVALTSLQVVGVAVELFGTRGLAVDALSRGSSPKRIRGCLG
jgi:hypothetical protein